MFAFKGHSSGMLPQGVSNLNWAVPPPPPRSGAKCRFAENLYKINDYSNWNDGDITFVNKTPKYQNL